MNLTNKILAIAAALSFCAFNAQAATDDEIAKRLEPVGQVCIQGKACTDTDAVATAGASDARSPDEIITKHCIACHGIGLLNAPKVGDTVAWKELADHQGGLDGLLARAIIGLNAMPAKGTCGDCSDDELRSAIQKMSGLE